MSYLLCLELNVRHNSYSPIDTGDVPPVRTRAELPYIAAAAVLAVALAHIPSLAIAVYPFKLFSTFVHEWSHVLVTIITGGHVLALRINPDLSGEEFSAGGWQVLISSAGYVGTAYVGAGLLLAPLRRANHILIGIGATVAALPLASTLLQGTAVSLTTWFWAIIFAIGTLAIGWRGALRFASLFQQFLAIEVCLTALDALRNLDWLTLNAPGIPTDASIAGSITPIPAIGWAVLWSVIGVAIVGLAGLRLIRRSFH